MRRADLADLTAFVAVADNLSFRAAASRLGVTPSALSHTMRQLEERLAVRLLNRTTRSVSLTDAGLRLLDRLRPAVEQISRALDDLKGEQRASLRAPAPLCDPPRRRGGHRARSGRAFYRPFPTSSSRSTADEAPVDIVAKGFDAGIGPKTGRPRT